MVPHSTLSAPRNFARHLYFGVLFFFLHKDPIYLRSVIIHSANGGKGEGCPVEERPVALLCG
jgi:hypothetical protein